LVVAADAGEAKGWSSDTPAAAAIAPDDFTNASLLSRSRPLFSSSGWDVEDNCEAGRPEYEVDDVVKASAVDAVRAAARRAEKTHCCDKIIDSILQSDNERIGANEISPVSV